MAEKETKIDLINPNPTRDTQGPPPGQKEKGPKKFILILGLAGFLFLAGAIGTAGYLGYIPILGISASDQTKVPQDKRMEMGEILKFSPLIINLNEPSGRHYLKTTLVLELDKKKLAEEIQSRMPVFMDSVILIVSEKKLEDLKSAEFKDRLKQELLDRFNGHLGGKGVRQIYFDEFLFQ